MGRQRLVCMVFGGNVGHGHHGQVMVEPQTHTLSFKASWAWMSPWPQMTAHVSQAEITPVVHSSYPRYKVSLGQQHESSWWPRSWASAKPLIVSNAMNINTEHGYNWAMDPNMVSGCTSGLGVIKALGCSTGYSVLHGHGNSMILGYHHGLRFQSRTLVSALHNGNRNQEHQHIPDCGRAMDSQHG